MVYDVSDERLTGERGLQGICDEGGVIAAALDVATQAVVQGARIRHDPYPPILAADPPMHPLSPTTRGVSVLACHPPWTFHPMWPPL